MKREKSRTDLAKGAVAGLLATVPMTGVMECYRRCAPLAGRDPFIPRQVAEGIARLARFEQHVDEMGEPGWWGLTAVSHFAFGGAAGAVYGMLEPILMRRTRPADRPKSVASQMLAIAPRLTFGASFGLVVWATHYLGLFPALGLIKPHGVSPIRKNIGLILSHLIWGAATSLIFDFLGNKAPRKTRPTSGIAAQRANQGTRRIISPAM